MSVTDLAALPPEDEEPAEDAAFLELLERLRPVFAELVKVSVEASIDAVPTPTFRPGQVTNLNASTGIATVIVDGDTAPISAQVICELPGVGDRVMVQFIPPATALVVGVVGGAGLPAGTVAFYAGPITADGLGADGAGSAPPRGWLRARGGLYLAERYPALFAAIGTTYNTGGESTNPVEFRVPNIADRFILPAGSSYYTLGATGGASSHTLSTGQLPSHTHDLGGHTHDLSGHTHSLSGSYGVSGTTGSAGSHQHGSPNGASFATDGGGPYLLGGGGTFNINTSAGASTASAGDHTHSFSGTVSLSGSTGGGSGSTGGPSGSSGSAGSGSSIDHMPPYIVLHAIIKA